MKTQLGSATSEGLFGLLIIAFMGATLAAWFTHLYVCFTDERWGFLIAGALFAPVAVIHGFGIWMGVW